MRELPAILQSRSNSIESGCRHSTASGIACGNSTFLPTAGMLLLSTITLLSSASAQQKPPVRKHNPNHQSLHRAANRRAAITSSPQTSRTGGTPQPHALQGGIVVQKVTPPAVKSPEQVNARALLRLMLKPLVPYVGVQETMIHNEGGTVSEQDIEGDSSGLVRIQFRKPEQVAGDVMIISPSSFHSYHRAKNLLEVAPWPTEWNDEGKRMFTNLVNGAVTARVVGAETVAGRQASIVVLSVANGAGVQGRVLRKLWIDPQTGILLRIEKSNATGQITSTTTMTSITVSPTTPINPADFKPKFPGAVVSPLFPEPQYHTLQEAQGHLPFQPLEPANGALPAGFQLDGVWGFGEDRQHPYQHSVLMRFSDGVATFCLYERVVPPARETPVQRPRRPMFARNQQTWRLSLSQGGEMNVQYIGHLTRDQAETLYDSLH